MDTILNMSNSERKTKAFVLPLSIEDNATIAGTASLLDDLAIEFDLPSAHTNPELLLYDNVKGSFDVNLARSRFEYLNSQHKQQSYMSDLEECLESKEKRLDVAVVSQMIDGYEGAEGEEDGEDEDDEREVETTGKDYASCTLESERHRFRKEDEEIWWCYNHLAARISNAAYSGSDRTFLSVII